LSEILLSGETMHPILLEKFDPRLARPEAERRFRAFSLDSDMRRARILLLLTALFHLASIPSDYTLSGTSDNFPVVLMIRLGSALLSLLTLFVIHLRRETASFFDDTIFLWAISLCVGIVSANSLLPRDYTTHIAWDIILTLGAYTVIPVSFSRQVIIAAMISVGTVLLFALHKVYTYSSTLPDVTLAFLCANLVGGFASWEIHRWRRSLFLSYEAERDAREKLEAAQREIRTLQGIISICASCKKVRTDEGQWRQVEAYVREHSEAEFSHSICPQCSEALYGEDG